MPELRPERESFLATAPSKTVIRAKLSADPPDVWAGFTDNSSWPKWFLDCSACEDTSEEIGTVGSTRRIVIGRLKVDEKFLVLDPPSRWAFTVTRTNLALAKAMVEEAQFRPVEGGGTDIIYTVAIEFPAVLKPLSGYITKRLRRSFEASFRNLENYLRAR